MRVGGGNEKQVIKANKSWYSFTIDLSSTKANVLKIIFIKRLIHKNLIFFNITIIEVHFENT